jgi:hypothetical protein
LWSVRSGGSGPNGAARAIPTGGRETSGGVVRFAVDAVCCGVLSCRVSEGLLVVERGSETRVLCSECARRWLL